MARRATGGWIPGALNLAEVTKNMDEAARRVVLKAEERAGRGTLATLNRQVAAVTWLSHRARRYGVELSDVVCAYPSIEALARLEKVRPDHADNVAADVLIGRITSRQVKTLADIGRDSIKDGHFWPNALEVCVIEEISDLVPGRIVEIVTAANKISKRGRLLKVDVELALDGGLAGVFFSPEIIYAQNSTLFEVWRAVTAARTIYQSVVFFSNDIEEQRFMKEHGPEVAPLAELFMPRTREESRAANDRLLEYLDELALARR